MEAEISKQNIQRLGDGKDKLIEKLVREIEVADTTLNPWRNNLVTYYELYKMYQRQKHYDGLAQLFVPEILRAVETIVSTLYQYIFGMDPWWEYQGRTPDEDPAAECDTELVNWQMDEGNFKMRVQDSLRQMAITGLTVRKLSWDFQQVNRKRKLTHVDTIFDSVTGKGKKNKKVETVDELETTRDHWVWEEVNLLGFYISNPSTPYYDISKADWIAEEYSKPRHWVKEKIKKGWFDDTYFDEISDEDLQQRSQTQRLKENLLLTSGYKNGERTQGVLLLERWGLLEAKYVYDDEQRAELDLDEDDMVETVSVLANRKFLIKLEANPYWHGQKPYISCPYVPQEYEFAGIGACQIGGKLQEELNDTRNQTMDNKTLILMCMWLKDRASGIKNQDLRVRPNGVIPTNSMQGLQPLRPPELTAVGVNIENVVKNDLRESVGAPSNLQGIAQNGVGSATESVQINNSAMGRLKMTAQLFSELMLKPTLIMVQYLNDQFYNEMKVIGVIGELGTHFKPLDPDDRVGHKNVILKLSTDLDESPAVRRQQLIQFLTITQQMQPDQIAFHWKLLNEIYKEFFKRGKSLEDIYQAPAGDEILVPPEDENKIMLMGHHVEVKEGDDDQDHILKHKKGYDTYKHVMSEDAFKEYTDHILAHHQKIVAKIQQATLQEKILQAQLAGVGQSPQSKGKGGATNMGQIPGASAFTQAPVSNPGDLTRNQGVA